MDKAVLKVKKMRPCGKIPSRATVGSAALDLCAAVDDVVIIEPHCFLSIPSGIAIELPDENYVAIVAIRSGISTKNNISLINGVGIIDSDYRGEILIGLINHSDSPFTIRPGDRIAQLMITGIFPLDVEVCDELGETSRGEGGFGSTGTK